MQTITLPFIIFKGILPTFNPKGPHNLKSISSFVLQKNKKVFAKAKNLFTISDDMKRTVAQYVDEEKIKVVYNWAHNEHLKPVEKSDNSFLKQLQLEDKFIVLYSGNMGMTHDIDVLVDVANALKENAKIHFLLASGDGDFRLPCIGPIHKGSRICRPEQGRRRVLYV